MDNSVIIHSSRWTISHFVSSAASLTTTALVVKTRAEDLLTTADAAPTAMISSDWIARSGRFRNRARRSRWVATPISVAMEAINPPSHPSTAPSALTENVAEAQVPAKPARTERIPLAIDSLQNYDLLKPIPVLIESLGDKVFVAEAPDLNVSITGNSVGAAFLLLKDHIVNLYEGYHRKKATDPERIRQLSMFEAYIGKTRRSWF